jgi:hypothetical protein
MPPRNKGKGKRTSDNGADDELDVVLPSSLPPARKKTRSDTVTQAPVRASSRKKVPARPRAATPAYAAPSSESGESFPSPSPSLPPDTPSNTGSNAGSSAPAVSLDASSMPDSQCSTAALDVWYFFEKGDRKLDTKSVCRICVCVPSASYLSLLLLMSYNYSKNIAANFQKYGKINHKYAPATGISNLRYHIECHHADEYIKICEEKNWPMMLAKQRAIDEQSNPGLQATSTDASRPAFSAKNLVRALVKFIVADDQVCACFSVLIYSNASLITGSQCS